MLRKNYITVSNHKKRDICEKIRVKDCSDSFKADKKSISSLERPAVRIKSIIRGSQGFSTRKLDVQKCYVYVAKLVAAVTTSPISSNLAAKD